MASSVRWACVGLLGAVTRCEPALDIDGAYFPAWLICMVAGGLLALGAYQVFVWTRIEPYLGHPLLVYPALYVLLTLLIWIVFYRT